MPRVRYSFSSRKSGHLENIKKQRSKIPELIKKLIDISDVLLEVLDARFIQDTRNLEIETLIKNLNKKIIYVVNKSDLVDLNETREKLEVLKLRPYVFVSCKYKKGVRNLKEKIQIEVSRISKEHARFHVGVIGYPNTGKSSLINLLTGRGAAKVAPQAGFTKGIQKIKLSSNILLLDSPGIIPLSESSTRKREFAVKHAKIGAESYNSLKEPEEVVLRLTQQFPGLLEKFYGFDIKGIKDFDDFIEKFGRKKSLLKKGNQIDEERACRIILKDWQEGKIRVN